MKHNSLRQSSYAVLAALIWGTAFVAQSMAAGAVPSFAFNASRAVIAFAFLLVLCVVLQAVRRRQGKPVSTTRSKKDLLLGGLCCGVAMGPCHLSSAKGLGDHYLRQGELYYHALHCADTHCRPFYEKAGAPAPSGSAWRWRWWACTACALRRALPFPPAISACCCAPLCSRDRFSLWITLQNMWTEWSSPGAQFFFMTIFSLAGTLLFETPTWAGIQGAMGQILYVGILSSGVAYTLQIMAQKDSDPAVISLLLSLESVFAAISGAVILGDRLSGREYFGCAVMLAAVVLAQLPEKKKAAV